MIATRQYDALDRLESIAYTAGSSTSSAAVVSSHAYIYDAAHCSFASRNDLESGSASLRGFLSAFVPCQCRTRATRDDGTHWQYGYNARDEVTSATKHLSGSGQMLAGWQQSFAYDNIGNCPFASRNDLESRFAECEPLIAACQCTTATEGGDASGQNRRTINYSTTNLNTYASIQRGGGGFDVLGRALTSATVTVNGQTLSAAERQGEHCPSTSRNDLETGSASLRESLSASAPCQWRKELSANNSDGPAFVPVTASATRPGVGVNGQAVTSTQTGGVFIDPAQLAPSHDPDGNLTADGRWHYSWDADNKLRMMLTHQDAIAAGAPEEKYEFTYDSGWRRIRQVVSRKATPNSAWVVVRDERTVYDEWNPVAQIDASGNVVQRHLWGIDLSGSAQGAGGVGGLLGTWDNGQTTRDGSRPGDGVARAWACAYDGNGNVSAVIALSPTGNGATGNQSTPRAARFDYDAFGKTLAAWGDAALGEANRYRFSTKPEDGTGLLYYGYRYLDARMGRWVSRDPIGERGGMNLFRFLSNSSNTTIDALGREEFDQNDPYDPNWNPKNLNDRADSKEILATFNCVGLATRTFAYVPDVRQLFGWLQSKNAKQLKNCDEKCGKCDIKFWIWQYTSGREANGLPAVRIPPAGHPNPNNHKPNPVPDFHVVAGKTSCDDGSDLANVYSKDGRRPIKGPDFARSWKPKARVQSTLNSPDEQLLYFDVNLWETTTEPTPYKWMKVNSDV